MKSEIIQTLINNFEVCTMRTKNGMEFWLNKTLKESPLNVFIKNFSC